MDSTPKPVWPHSSICTLTPHPSGSWCKKVQGKMKYFGPLGNPDLALKNYLAFATANATGISQTERRVDRANVTLDLVTNHFLVERGTSVNNGELTAMQYTRYRTISVHLVKILGKDRTLESLGPQDFAALRNSLTGGMVTIKNKITWIRTILGWAEDYYGVKVAYGSMFKKPSRRAMEQSSKKRVLFTPHEIQALLKLASPTVRPFVLLAINCGFGQNDISGLPWEHVDLKGGVIRHPRGKTSIPRINPLWPETIKAIKKYARPNQMRADLVFITRFGEPFVRETPKYDAAGLVKSTTRVDSLSQEFDKLCDEAKVTRRGFYAFRHTFRSVADEVADTTAIECLMGHLKPGMGGVYTQLMSNGMQRLKAVTDHVRRWAMTPQKKPRKACD